MPTTAITDTPIASTTSEGLQGVALTTGLDLLLMWARVVEVSLSAVLLGLLETQAAMEDLAVLGLAIRSSTRPS